MQARDAAPVNVRLSHLSTDTRSASIVSILSLVQKYRENNVPLSAAEWTLCFLVDHPDWLVALSQRYSKQSKMKKPVLLAIGHGYEILILWNNLFRDTASNQVPFRRVNVAITLTTVTPNNEAEIFKMGGATLVQKFMSIEPTDCLFDHVLWEQAETTIPEARPTIFLSTEQVQWVMLSRSAKVSTNEKRVVLRIFLSPSNSFVSAIEEHGIAKKQIEYSNVDNNDHGNNFHGFSPKELLALASALKEEEASEKSLRIKEIGKKGQGIEPHTASQPDSGATTTVKKSKSGQTKRVRLPSSKSATMGSDANTNDIESSGNIDSVSPSKKGKISRSEKVEHIVSPLSSNLDMSNEFEQPIHTVVSSNEKHGAVKQQGDHDSIDHHNDVNNFHGFSPRELLALASAFNKEEIPEKEDVPKKEDRWYKKVTKTDLKECRRLIGKMQFQVAETHFDHEASSESTSRSTPKNTFENSTKIIGEKLQAIEDQGVAEGHNESNNDRIHTSKPLDVRAEHKEKDEERVASATKKNKKKSRRSREKGKDYQGRETHATMCSDSGTKTIKTG